MAIAHTLLKSVDEAVDDDMSDEERARLEVALERSLAQADAGQTVPADEVCRALRAQRAPQGGFVSNDEDEDAEWTTLEFLQTKIAVRV